MSRGGLRFIPGAVQQLKEECENAYRLCSGRLFDSNTGAIKAFCWDGKKVELDKERFPKQKPPEVPGNLRGLLEAEFR